MRSLNGECGPDDEHLLQSLLDTCDQDMVHPARNTVHRYLTAMTLQELRSKIQSALDAGYHLVQRPLCLPSPRQVLWTALCAC